MRNEVAKDYAVESAIICSKSVNVIVGSMYKHSVLQINDFKSDFMTSSLSQLQKESDKIFFLLGDSNTDLLKFELSDTVNDFIDTLSSNFFLPRIILPTKISKTCTLIDNVFLTKRRRSSNIQSSF